ncbi:MAG: serine/threonine protein kinase [Bacteroidetes bacterium]|nr:MAG: serine/threonine protein kinase [Bacteroidota bacterium]
MFKDQNIRGYRILQDFTTAGGGLSKWTFALKNGVEYFMKEFLSPKYPTPDSPGSPASKQRKREECERFEEHHRTLIQEINEKCGIGSNLVVAVDFFRQDTKYYKVTEKVDVSSLTVGEIAELPLSARHLIMKTITHSLNILHRANIVHGDLKPDNVLIKQTKTAYFTAKLIDFDNSYFVGKPPEIVEDMVGDMVYYSPELASYIRQDERIKAKDLTTKSDIFALGLLFCQYLTGKMPVFDREKYAYPCLAVGAGEKLVLEDANLPTDLQELVNQMLVLAYKDRPSTQEVFEKLKNIDFSAYLTEDDKRKPATLVSKMKLPTATKKETLPTETEPKIALPTEEKKEEEKPKGLRGMGLKIGKKEE